MRCYLFTNSFEGIIDFLSFFKHTSCFFFFINCTVLRIYTYKVEAALNSIPVACAILKIKKTEKIKFRRIAGTVFVIKYFTISV